MKRFLASISGIVTGIVLIALLEALLFAIMPHPAGVDYNNPESVKRAMESMPASTLAFVLVAYALAAFGGGVVATLVGKRASAVPALITGGVLTIAAIVNLVTIPHPMWFMILNLAEYVPCAYAGFFVTRRPA